MELHKEPLPRVIVTLAAIEQNTIQFTSSSYKVR